MFDLATIHQRDQKAIDVWVHSHALSSTEQLDKLALSLRLDLIWGRNAEVLDVCDKLVDVGLECAQKALDGITNHAPG